MLKKLFIVIFFTTLFLNTVYGQQFNKEKDFTVQRTSDGNSVIITGYTGKDTEINIPPQFSKRPVTRIGDNAFKDKNLTNITIPDTVTSIGHFAFANNKLTNFTIPNNVTTIGVSAFINNQLTNISIPNTVNQIGDNAFSNNQIINLNISNNLSSINDSSFANNKLTTIIIPDSVISISSLAFANNQLTNVTLGNKVNSIGSRAFSNNQLSSIIIPDSVTLIANDAFEKNLFSILPITKKDAEKAQTIKIEQDRLSALYKQAGQNIGNLKNTAWRFRQPLGNTYIEGRFDFGEGNFILQQNQHDRMFAVTVKGNFRVLRDNVIFMAEDGTFFDGNLIGNSLTVNRPNTTVNNPIYNRIN